MPSRCVRHAWGGRGVQDSNCEGALGTDYPDEESGSEHSDSDDDNLVWKDDGFGGGRWVTPAMDDAAVLTHLTRIATTVQVGHGWRP